MLDHRPHIMVVDDEKEICNSLARVMKDDGFQISVFHDGMAALEAIAFESPAVVLCDIRMPGLDGMEVLKKIKTMQPELPVIMITAYADIPGAVEAMRAGAHDYLAKPFDHNEVLRVVRRALAEHNLKLKINILSKQPQAETYLREGMGPSDAVSRLISEAMCVANSDFTVIILGESGSGKELIGRAIHQASHRSKGPFLGVDCGAIPEEIFESELFGHEKGAFTGAGVQKLGKFEIAKGGTLLLDEIGNMPLASQVKLLRALQEKKIFRVGGIKLIDIDVRLMVASNSNLEDALASGSFRQDLFYRLNEYVIKVPPLRERVEDIPYLANRFLGAANKELGKNVKGLSMSCLDALLAYHWPGNVRQLQSAIRRATLVADDVIQEAHLALSQFPEPGIISTAKVPDLNRHGFPFKEIVNRATKSIEREILCKVLAQTGGNKAKAARILHIDYKTIHTKVKELGITIGGGEYGKEKGHRSRP